MAHTVVCIEIPYPLMWGKVGWLPLRMEGKDYEIGFERAWRPGVSNFEIKHDRLGRMSYTKVAIRFPYATIGDDSDELKRVAHLAINRLLDVYRARTKECHVGHIPIHELGVGSTSHGVYTVDDDGSTNELHSLQYDIGSGVTLARMQEIESQATWT